MQRMQQNLDDLAPKVKSSGVTKDLLISEWLCLKYSRQERFTTMLRFLNVAIWLKPIQISQPLIFKSLAGMGLQGSSGWQKEHVLTQRIKQAKKKQQVEELIKKYGLSLNIIHLTAVLDRIQEEQMHGVHEVVDFVLDRLQAQGDFFSRVTVEKIRTVCNIVCYLGNLKRTDLNHIFRKIDFSTCVKSAKPIEVTMLVTGLVRLGLFSQAFSVQKEQGESDKIAFADVLRRELTTQQIASIWFAMLLEKIEFNSQFHHQFINKLLSSSMGQLSRSTQLSLKVYAYGVICYFKTQRKIDRQSRYKLQNWLGQIAPPSVIQRSSLKLYQLSIFLNALKALKKTPTYTVILPTHSVGQLRGQLQVNLRKMCSHANLTLRNMANSYIAMEESLGTSNEMRQEIAVRLGDVCKWAKNKIKQGKNDSDRVDTLSLSSLIWKLGHVYQRKNSEENRLKKGIQNVMEYLLALNQAGKFTTMPNSQLLMLYSGLGMLAGRNIRFTDPKIVQMSVDAIATPEKEWSVKEVTFFYTYFRHMRFHHPTFCKWVAFYYSKEDPLWLNCKAARHLQIEPKACLMNLQLGHCKGCFSQSSQT